MWRVLLILAVYASVADSRCKGDAQCPDNYYCANDSIHVCLECLSCEKLQREPALVKDDCIKSVADCGSCFAGLVADAHGDINSPCVPPDVSELSVTPTYVWPLVGVGVAVAIVLVVAIIALYLWRHDDFFKTVGASPSVTAVIASAPEAPPPYNPAQYAPVHATPPYSHASDTIHEEDESPFIKRAPSTRGAEAREAAGSQAARPYNRPAYERELSDRSPTPEFPSDDSTDPLDNFTNIHDEATVESPWTPDTTMACNNEDATATAGGSLSVPALVAAARGAALLDPSPAKKKRLSQDTNNNRNRDNSTSSSEQSTFTQLPQASNGVTIIAQINNVCI